MKYIFGVVVLLAAAIGSAALGFRIPDPGSPQWWGFFLVGMSYVIWGRIVIP